MKSFWIALLILACMIFVSLVALKPEWFMSDSYALQGRLNFLRIGSPVFVAVLAFGLYFILKPLLHHGAAITLSETELKWAFLPKDYALTWSKIERIQIVYQQGAAFVAIALKEPEAYRQFLGWYGRYTNDWNIKKFGASIVISTVIFKTNGKEVEKHIMKAFETFQTTGPTSKEWWTMD